uniref:Uncharacterized protein n=1 Tax=virus sp. ctx9V1 TaxID=2828001 RepID=A0A8S5RCZ1_9VIRU|nr:MAG TPA: hypothetical protein [virus sp. ctx9V1]
MSNQNPYQIKLHESSNLIQSSRLRDMLQSLHD